VLDRIGAGAKGEVDSVRAMGVDGDPLAVEMGGLDDGARFVLEHLGTEAEADAAVDSAGGGDLDDVDSAGDLAAHRSAAIVGAVAGAAGLAELVVEFLANAERGIHVAGGGRDAGAGIDDSRAGRPAARDRVAKPQGDSAFRAEVADGGEAGVEGLAGVPGGLIGAKRDVFGKPGELSLHPRPVRGQMDVGIDQSWQHEAVGKVDQPRSRRRRCEAVPDRLDAPAPDEDRRVAARRPSGAVEQGPGVDDDDIGRCRRRRRALGRGRSASDQNRREHE
jgi:hypothetical protein